MHRFLIPNNYSLWLPPDNPKASNAIDLSIKSLATRDRISLKKKVFANKTVYTIAVDSSIGKHRLIFERVTLLPKNETAFVLQGIALYHDYRKALTWEPLNSLSEEALLGSYIEMNRRDVIDETTCNEVYFDRQWLQPTFIQTQALSQVSLPHLVTGPPGSGKTLLSLAFFQELALKHQASGTGLLKLLFISSQPDLNTTLKRSWREWASLSLSEEMPRIHLQFMTFSELTSWREKEEKPRELVNEETLLGLIERHQRSILCPLTAREVMAEFMVSSHVLNEQTPSRYCAMGINQISVLPAHKETIYRLYHRVMQDLGDSVYPGLSVVLPCEASFQFHYAAVDEAQSVGVQDLKNVWNVTEGGKILYCGDSYQRGACKVSSISLLETCLYTAYGVNLTKTMLVETHRLKPSVAFLCNDLVLLSNTLNEGITDKASYSTFSVANRQDEATSSLSWIDTYTAEFKQLGRDAKSAAIVISPQDIAAAKDYINGSNVFLVNEARGQQFSRVFLYVSSETLKTFIDLNQRMQAREILPDSQLKVLPHASSKKGMAQETIYFEILSDLMVALSRSYGDVWIFFETESKMEQHRLNYILPWLKKRCIGHMNITDIESTREEWLGVIHQFIMNGARPQALENLMRHFALDERRANQYIALCEENGLALTVSEGMIWLAAAVRPALSMAAVLEPSEAVIIPPIPSQVTSAPFVKVASNKKEKAALTPSTPACVKKLETEEGIGDMNALMGELLTLKTRPAGKWLFSHSVRGLSVFEHIFLDHRAIIKLALYLAKEESFRLFFSELLPYLNQGILSNSAITHFQLMVVTLADKKILPVYSLIIQKALSIASVDGLNDPIQSPRSPKGASLLFLLLGRTGDSEREQFISSALVNKVTQKGLTREIEEGPHKGKNLLFFLFGNDNYAHYWGAIKNQLTAIDWAFTYNTVDDSLRNSTPLFLLCRTDKGRQFLKKKWEFFRDKISPELFHQPLTGEGLDQGKTAFFYLCQYREGLEILREHWDDFKDTITTQRLLQRVTGNDPQKGYTLFLTIMCDEASAQFLYDHWLSFKAAVTIDMFLQTGDDCRANGLFCLFATKLGHQFLDKHGFDFMGGTLPEILFQPVLRGAKEIKSPFYYLCGIPEGTLIIRKYWDMFSTLMTADRMSQTESTNEIASGHTFLSLLCGHEEGILLLSDYWNALFKDMFTAHTLEQPVLGEFGKVETSVLISFCLTKYGVNFLEAHWSDFKEIITKDALHQTVSIDCESKGVTPLYLLCQYSYGRQLLKHHWVDFRNKITDKGLLQPLELNDLFKGTTPIYYLLIAPDGIQLLHDNWADFKDKFTKTTLHQPVFDEGPYKNKTLFHFICISPEGRQLLKNHWADFKNIITRESLNQLMPLGERNIVKTIFQCLSEDNDFHDLLTPLMHDQAASRAACGFFATTTDETRNTATSKSRSRH
jgi:hypothetical protein